MIFFRAKSERKPMKNAVINPAESILKGIPLEINSGNSRSEAPNIAGMAIRNENLKASSFLCLKAMQLILLSRFLIFQAKRQAPA